MHPLLDLLAQWLLALSPDGLHQEGGTSDPVGGPGG